MVCFNLLLFYLNAIKALIKLFSLAFFHQTFLLIKGNEFQFGLTLLGIITTWIVTFLTINNVNRNTNKQIENQNKISYRPYLKIQNVTEKRFQSGFKAYCSKNNESSEKEKILNIFFEIKNIGNGIATGFTMFDVDNEFETVKNDILINLFVATDLECFEDSEEVSIEKDGDFKFNLRISHEFGTKELIRNFIFIFQDIDMNLYGLNVELRAYHFQEKIIYKVSKIKEYNKQWKDFYEESEIKDYVKKIYLEDNKKTE